MNKICTSQEQSQRLMELGIDVNTADMYYHPYPNDEGWYDSPNIGNADLKYNQLPCWSLSALLDFLKPNVYLKYEVGWEVYSHYIIEKNQSSVLHDIKTIKGFSKSNAVDACYEMIKKLHEFKLML